MDCDLARLLLAFTRPGELPAADSDAVARHLATCAACAARASDAGAFDGAVALAMRAVPPPVAGRAGALRVVELAAAARRRSVRVRISAGVAAVMAAAGLAAGATARLRPEADGDRIVADAGTAFENREKAVVAYFAEAGLPPPPFDFDYALHVGHGRMPILGTDAPAVVFALPGPGGPVETATAFALSPSRFRVAELQFGQASFYTVTVLDDPAGSGLKWAVVTTTPTPAPFARKPL